jgi:TonB family protein
MKTSLIFAIAFLCLSSAFVSAQEANGTHLATVQVTENGSFNVAQNGQAVNSVGDTTRMDEPPLTIFTANPTYPTSALKEKAEGLVETKLYIDKQGGVSKVEVVKSSGRQDLDNAGVEAAKQYRFTPAKLNGKPVSIDVTIPFQFRLTSSLSTAANRMDRTALPPIIVNESDKAEEKAVNVKDLKGDGKPSFSRIVRPKYPEISKMKHSTGEVNVAVTIDENGNVISVGSSSNESDDLVHAALAAAARCKFVPGRRNGQPVESSALVTYLFGRNRQITDQEYLEAMKAKSKRPLPLKEVNPENAGTSIAFKNDANSTDTMVVFDLRGMKIRTTSLGHLSAGAHEIVWDGKDDSGKEVITGVYFYQIFATPDDGSARLKYMGKAIIKREQK